MSDLRNKLGVDYMRQSAPEKRSVQQSSDFLDEAVILFGARILESVAKDPKGEKRLHVVVQELDISLADALRVADYLSDRGMVEIRDRDKLGNHLLVITGEGRKLVEQRAR